MGRRKKGNDKKEDGEADEEEDELDEDTLAEDRRCRKLLHGLLNDNADVLKGKFISNYTEIIRPSHSGREENLDGLDMDKDKKSLVSREIKSFRDSYRKEDRKREEEKEKREKEL